MGKVNGKMSSLMKVLNATIRKRGQHGFFDLEMGIVFVNEQNFLNKEFFFVNDGVVKKN